MDQAFPRRRDTYTIVLMIACIVFCVAFIIIAEPNPLVLILLAAAAVLLVVEFLNKAEYRLGHDGLTIALRIGSPRRIAFSKIRECKAIKPSARRLDVAEPTYGGSNIRIMYADGKKIRTTLLKPEDPVSFIKAFDTAAKGRCKVITTESLK